MASSNSCTHCGSNLPLTTQAQTPPGISEKSATAAFWFCFFLGNLGVHRYYVGRIWTGLLMLFTAGGLGIWTIIDMFLIVFDKFKDEKNNRLIMAHKAIPIIAIFVSFFFIWTLVIAAAALQPEELDVIEDQISALHSGNYEKAYSYTSTTYKNTNSLGAFKTMVEQNPILKSRAVFKANQSRLTVQGTLRNHGQDTPVEYSFIKEDDDWKISSINITKTATNTTKGE